VDHAGPDHDGRGSSGSNVLDEDDAEPVLGSPRYPAKADTARIPRRHEAKAVTDEPAIEVRMPRKFV
jgi:hypothetical protein